MKIEEVFKHKCNDEWNWELFRLSISKTPFYFSNVPSPYIATKFIYLF